MTDYLFYALCLLAGCWITWQLHKAARLINAAERVITPRASARAAYPQEERP